MSSGNLFGAQEMLQEQAHLVTDRMWIIKEFSERLDVEMAKAQDEMRVLLKSNPTLLLRRKQKREHKWFETLLDFTVFCTKNPDLRFWQALRTWVRAPFILISDHVTMDFQDHEQDWLDDTYYRQGK